MKAEKVGPECEVESRIMCCLQEPSHSPRQELWCTTPSDPFPTQGRHTEQQDMKTKVLGRALPYVGAQRRLISCQDVVRVPCIPLFTEVP